MLAKRHNGTPAKGWWMSEKLDGVRAVWNGSDFISRNGKILPAPEVMKANMPTGVTIDGELFGGRGQFQKTVGGVKRGDWRGITYMAFDLITGCAFEARQEALSALRLPDWCKVVAQTKCASEAHLEQYEKELVAKGAEGVMIRKPQSYYKNSRSNDLLKIKRFQCSEAVVIGYEPGAGKHINRVGALLAKHAGQVFKIGTGLTNEQRETPPPVGSVVTFSFFEFTDSGKPRFPAFIGVRDYE